MFPSQKCLHAAWKVHQPISFNGAGMFPSQKYGAELQRGLHGGPLQWGRDVSIPEMMLGLADGIAPVPLQWGRDVSIPEMGSPGQGLRLPTGFNGAGMFPSQKFAAARIGKRGLPRASMGPGCFHPRNGPVGNPAKKYFQSFNGAGMFPSQKLNTTRSRGRRWAASMGPGCFHPRNDGNFYKDPVLTGLQWGRDVSIPEMFSKGRIAVALIRLQWGRDVSIPEIWMSGFRRRRRSSFNGAGMFPSQK